MQEGAWPLRAFLTPTQPHTQRVGDQADGFCVQGRWEGLCVCVCL